LNTEAFLKLGNTIRRCRFDMNETSQEALADAVGVTRQTILAIEKGKFVPSTLLAFRIARFFGKTVEDVFYLVEEDEK
jgi:putative transcriptional regulator